MFGGIFKDATPHFLSLVVGNVLVVVAVSSVGEAGAQEEGSEGGGGGPRPHRDTARMASRHHEPLRSHRVRTHKHFNNITLIV